MGWSAGRHVDHPCGGRKFRHGLLEKSLNKVCLFFETNCPNILFRNQCCFHFWLFLFFFCSLFCSWCMFLPFCFYVGFAFGMFFLLLLFCACFVSCLLSEYKGNLALRTPRPATGVSRALQARSVPGVSPRVSPKTGGVRGSVRRGVSGALRAPGSGVSKKCPESVPGVSKRCPGQSGDTLGTLFGHYGAQGPKGPGDTPSDTPSDTPGFRGHSRGHSADTSGLKGPRDSCSRPGRSQTLPSLRFYCLFLTYVG